MGLGNSSFPEQKAEYNLATPKEDTQGMESDSVLAFRAEGFEAAEMDGRNTNRFNGVFVDTGERRHGRAVYGQQGANARSMGWHDGCWRYYTYYDRWQSGGDRCTFFVESEATSPLTIPHDAQWHVHDSAMSHVRGTSSFSVHTSAHSSQNKEPVDFLIVGSSVAKAAHGWSGMLTNALANHGRRLVNAATGGNNTTKTMRDLREALMSYKPKVIIIALSTGNEGLKNTRNEEEAWAIGNRFEKGSQALIQLAKSCGAQVVIGSVYPNQNYQQFHDKVLKEVYLHQHQWGVPVLEFLPATDDGNGHWLPGTWWDPGHPNQKGHQLMFEAIDVGQLLGLCDSFQHTTSDCHQGKRQRTAE